jgi:hypothetical protein
MLVHVDYMVILKWIFEKQGERVWIGFNWLRTRTDCGLV